jgi:lipoprotein-anchoring transpeptidase ErfK/SrfK
VGDQERLPRQGSGGGKVRTFVTGAIAFALAGGTAGIATAAEDIPTVRTDDVPITAYQEDPTDTTLDPAPKGDEEQQGDDSGKGDGETTKPQKPKVKEVPVSYRISPGSSGKYGVGQLVTMTFDRPVARRSNVEEAITVTSNRKKKLSKGAWGWIDRQTAIYRPKKFWPGNARITFDVDLKDVILAAEGNTRYVGARNRDYVLRTDRKLVIKIRDAKHRLYVYRDNKMIKSFPVSLGKVEGGYQTRSGIKILTGEQYVKLRMIGTDRLTGEDWDVISPYSIRLTPTGEFIHGAPWAYSRIGSANGSHGCTNMRVADAKWLFHRVMRGDPTVTTGTGRPMEVTNGTPGAYWNYSWKQWLQKSATKGKQASSSEDKDAGKQS